jgi:Divergent InlB B-repeat domain/PASTA domain
VLSQQQQRSFRFGWVRASLLVGAFVTLVLLPASAAGARSATSFTAASSGWAIGVEAGLPANALASSQQTVSISSVSCPSAGNCSAVGTYKDSSGDQEGLLLSKAAGLWATGVEASLPANADTNSQFVDLNSLSCASAGNCTAVGSYTSSGYSRGLLLTETAGTWSRGSEVTPPANADGTTPTLGLASVACPSVGNCSAVGSYKANSDNNTEALLLTETAGIWGSGLEAALPADAASTNEAAGLGSISCPSAGNCTAVGGYLFMSGPDSWASQGLMVTETAGSWATAVEPALPANAMTPNPNVELSSVSCASAGNCSAVGAYTDNSPSNGGLLLTQTAGTWATGIEATLPANATTQAPGPLYALDSVSCTSVGNCSAVGTYFDNSFNGRGVLLTQQSGTWAPGVEAKPPSNAATTGGFVSLTSISCPSAGECSAVGAYNLSGSGSAGLLLTKTANSWATGLQASLPSNGGYGNLAINSVSCATAGNCSAVGWYTPTAAAAGEQGLLLNSPVPTVTLTVSRNGTGVGTVSSSPTGINCGTTCSHGYTQGTSVTLTATPAAGSTFAGWSDGCSGTGQCMLKTDADTAVTASFSLVPKPKPCVVPKLEGKSLSAATRSIKSHACTVGRIKHATSRAVKKGNVISQKPKPGSRLKHGAKVNLVVSKGKH